MAAMHQAKIIGLRPKPWWHLLHFFAIKAAFLTNYLKYQGETRFLNQLINQSIVYLD